MKKKKKIKLYPLAFPAVFGEGFLVAVFAGKMK